MYFIVIEKIKLFFMTDHAYASGAFLSETLDASCVGYLNSNQLLLPLSQLLLILRIFLVNHQLTSFLPGN